MFDEDPKLEVVEADFSKLEAAEDEPPVLSEDIEEYDEKWPRKMWSLTWLNLIRILSMTSKRFLASMARTCADESMPLKSTKLFVFFSY